MIKTLASPTGEFISAQGKTKSHPCADIENAEFPERELYAELIDTVIKYIDNQKEHHAKVSYPEEYKSVLQKYNLNFDERYLWD